MRDDGNQGSRPGSTFQDMRTKARAGKLHGKDYPQDSRWASKPGVNPSEVSATELAGRAGKRGSADSPLTGHSPYERAQPLKPGA